MIFTSFNFMVFLCVTLLLYGVARTPRERAGVMLAASLIFYASWKPAYLVLLLGSLSVNYVMYLRLLAKRSRALLVGAVAANLVFLGIAKYLAFATSSLFALATVWGADTPDQAPAWMRWALPLGISFYTFHMLSAMFDVYRGTWAKHVSFDRWCLYVTFFPHLIAGPILRPGQLIDQLGELAPLQADTFRLGGTIFVAGLLKKTLLADNLASIADATFGNPFGLDAVSAWVGTLAFAFQIYFDFSGYSEMAIGLALLFGVALPRNFLYPYISRNPTEFWRRWHVTLSQWLRDYLYIALGGNRGSSIRTYLNLLTTMLLGGLWHGANWTFVIWGGLHGLYLIGHRLLSQAFVRCGVVPGSPTSRTLSLAGIPLTFALVLVTWVFFRASGFREAWAILSAMFGMSATPGSAVHFRLYELAIVGTAGAIACLEPAIVTRFERHGILAWWRVPFVLRGAAYATLVMVVVAFGGPTQKFIYFDF